MYVRDDLGVSRVLQRNSIHFDNLIPDLQVCSICRGTCNDRSHRSLTFGFFFIFILFFIFYLLRHVQLFVRNKTVWDKRFHSAQPCSPRGKKGKETLRKVGSEDLHPGSCCFLLEKKFFLSIVSKLKHTFSSFVMHAFSIDFLRLSLRWAQEINERTSNFVCDPPSVIV